MLELLRLFGLRFMFHADDHDPMQVHVVKGKDNTSPHAKFNLFPLEVVENDGLSDSETKLAEAVIEENKDLFAERWTKYMKKSAPYKSERWTRAADVEFLNDLHDEGELAAFVGSKSKVWAEGFGNATMRLATSLRLNGVDPKTISDAFYRVFMDVRKGRATTE